MRHHRRWLSSAFVRISTVMFTLCLGLSFYFISKSKVNAGDSASGEVVRITAIRDYYQPNHDFKVEVTPGEVIQFSADIMDANNNYAAKDMAVEDFNWKSSYRDSDLCNISKNDQCLDLSNFEVTDNGVTYHVPYNWTDKDGLPISEINIFVTSDSLPGHYDEVTLVNRLAIIPNVPYEVPTTVVSTPDDYSYNNYNDSLALAGLGQWIVVDGVTYWSPNVTDADWTPYTQGYWADTDDYVQVWTGAEPWSWRTDHYGVWRRHGVYGWLWQPFADGHYEPHTATFFYRDNYIGWYPFFNHEGWRDTYRQGYNEGFIDGFEEGYDFTTNHSNDWRNYRFGLTLIRHENWGWSDSFASVRIADANIIFDFFSTSLREHSYGHWLGGESRDDYDHYRHHVLNDLHVAKFEIPHTTIKIKEVNKIKLVNTVRVRDIPKDIQIKNTISVHDRLTQRVALGSIVRGTANPHQKIEVIRPTKNGRGISAAPRVYDSNTGESHPIKSNVHKPAELNPANSVAHQPVKPLQLQPVVKPTYHPNQPPTPKPTPKPTPGAHPTPTSHPTPHPTAHPNPTATPVPHPTSTPHPTPHPTPVHPVPTAHPVPHPTSTPHPTPHPTATPVPHPTPVHPVPTAHPIPTSYPVPHPTPTHPHGHLDKEMKDAVAPKLKPTPHPTATPHPTPHPTAHPHPTATPVPHPTPHPHSNLDE